MGNAPVYLFTGPEVGERNDAILQLRVAARKRSGSLDEHTFYASETKFPQIMNLLLSESLFSSARFVVFHGAELLKKKRGLGATGFLDRICLPQPDRAGAGFR